jgi:hypothetical protein
MAIAYVQDLPNATQELYDAIVRELGGDAIAPAGLIVHAAGPHGDGWRIIDIWESQEALETFDRELLGPARERVFAAMNIVPAGPAPTSDIMQIHHLLTFTSERG